MKTWILLAAFVGVAGGCATTERGLYYEVMVDAISASEIGPTAGQRYVLVPADEDVSADNLKFKEFARYAHRALGSRGYTPVEHIEDAHVVITLAYGISDPQVHQETVAVPTWGQTGVSSSSTYGTISPYGSFSATTTHTTTYGVTGYRQATRTRVDFIRYVVLTAFERGIDSGGSPDFKSIWQTSASSIGTTSDLRRAVPALVAAARPYLGADTGKRVRMTIHERDAAVLEVKGTTNAAPDQKCGIEVAGVSLWNRPCPSD